MLNASADSNSNWNLFGNAGGEGGKKKNPVNQNNSQASFNFFNKDMNDDTLNYGNNNNSQNSFRMF